MDRLERLDGIIELVEQTVLVTFLTSMLVVACLQIVLRNLFFTGLAWGDALVRNLVLWVGFIGAALATKEGKHINIDVASRWMPPLGKALVSIVVHLFSSVVCGLLTFGALKFIKNEAEMGSITFLEIPAWIAETILPFTFGLMTFRFFLHFVKSLSILLKTGKEK